jgi:hypothetical protein
MTTDLTLVASDLDDQQWLDQQVATLGDGIEAARAIWDNWSDLRNVGRLHPGQSAGDFIAAQLGGVRLDLPRLIAALPAMSNRQLAAVAGVSEGTVRNNRGAQIYAPDAEPARVIGADGKSYPGRVVRGEVIEPAPLPVPPAPDRNAVLALLRAIDAVESVRDQFKPAELAEAVVPKDRSRMWRDLRRAGTFLGSVALLLEGERQ